MLTTASRHKVLDLAFAQAGATDVSFYDCGYGTGVVLLEAALRRQCTWVGGVEHDQAKCDQTDPGLKNMPNTLDGAAVDMYMLAFYLYAYTQHAATRYEGLCVAQDICCPI